MIHTKTLLISSIIDLGFHVKIDLGGRKNENIDSHSDSVEKGLLFVENSDEKNLNNYDDGNEEVKEVENERRDYYRYAASSEGPYLRSLLEKLKKYESLPEQEQLETLENIGDLAHDILHGVTVAKDGVDALMGIAVSEKSSKKAKELSIISLGATFNNNEEAILASEGKSLVKKLLQLLAKVNDDTIRRRIVYAISSIESQSKNYQKEFLANDGSKLYLSIFENSDDMLKKRILQVVSTKTSTDWPLKEIQNWSNMLQNNIIHEPPATYKWILFSVLTRLHEHNELNVDEHFLDWISKEAEALKQTRAEGEEQNYREEVLKARHLVFGNPKAARKDEL